MLYPQSNSYRQMFQLPNFWNFRFDPENIGVNHGWMRGFDSSIPIAVPASWNDQFADMRDNLGPAWYQIKFDLPWKWEDHRIYLRFGSVNYLAEVWLNGKKLGEHEGGHLPFEFDITQVVTNDDNCLVVRVDGDLAPDRVPPGKIPEELGFSLANQSFPETNFDFFPYCGIQRPVFIYSTPFEEISDLKVYTDFESTRGIVRVKITTRFSDVGLSARIKVHGDEKEISVVCHPDQAINYPLIINDVKLWSPQSPYLYTMVVELIKGDTVIDRYSLNIGIRTIRVEGDNLLLNNEPIYLRGFGRHEDFPISGRGYFPPVIIKDFALMHWIGANSFRTTHYPYSDEMMDLADRLGFLVIDEIPAVGLFFKEGGLEKRLNLCRQFIKELINRDQNHPSVIIWSLANEPHSEKGVARDYFYDLYHLSRVLDTTRPITLVSSVGLTEEAFEFLDLVCVNRYYGWYSDVGHLDDGILKLSNELDQFYLKYKKPIILTEFGADAIPGVHAQPSELFSEEFQAEMLEKYIKLFRSKPYMVGEHVWNLCDFKTAQAIRRMGGINYKGVFTRDRKPKLAAHRIRAIWNKQEE